MRDYATSVRVESREVDIDSILVDKVVSEVDVIILNLVKDGACSKFTSSQNLRLQLVRFNISYGELLRLASL